MLPNWYNKYKGLIERSINNYLLDYFKNQNNPGLDLVKEATIYSVQGGKKVRSILALEFFLNFTDQKIEDIKKTDNIIKFCIALELLHSFSLIHDDLPCMDNDEYRRGELTTWKKYGEVNAVLVGDLLNSLSFEILAETKNNVLIKYFGQAVGLKGMIGGQVLDLYYEKQSEKLTLENLLEVHNKKTGCLIEMSVLGGLILANKSLDKDNKFKKNEIIKYSTFGKQIGLAFQIKDDLLDVEGSFEETGKSVGGEDKGFVYFLGLEKTKQYLEKIIKECSSIIKPLKSEKLDFIVDYVASRKK